MLVYTCFHLHQKEYRSGVPESYDRIRLIFYKKLTNTFLHYISADNMRYQIKWFLIYCWVLLGSFSDSSIESISQWLTTLTFFHDFHHHSYSNSSKEQPGKMEGQLLWRKTEIVKEYGVYFLCKIFNVYNICINYFFKILFFYLKARL